MLCNLHPWTLKRGPLAGCCLLPLRAVPGRISCKQLTSALRHRPDTSNSSRWGHTPGCTPAQLCTSCRCVGAAATACLQGLLTSMPNPACTSMPSPALGRSLPPGRALHCGACGNSPAPLMTSPTTRPRSACLQAVQQQHVGLVLLEKSGIGGPVSALRSHPDPQLAALANEMSARCADESSRGPTQTPSWLAWPASCLPGALMSHATRYAVGASSRQLVCSCWTACCASSQDPCTCPPAGGGTWQPWRTTSHPQPCAGPTLAPSRRTPPWAAPGQGGVQRCHPCSHCRRRGRLCSSSSSSRSRRLLGHRACRGQQAALLYSMLIRSSSCTCSHIIINSRRRRRRFRRCSSSKGGTAGSELPPRPPLHVALRITGLV